MEAPPGEVRPELSVVIATRNRRDLLRRCLEGLARQAEPSTSFEVVVVDDSSTDGTGDLLEAISTPFSLRVLRVPQGGQFATLNAGITEARGRICLFLDDDMIPSSELIGAHLAAHREGGRILAIGRVIQQPPVARDWYAQSFATAWNRHFDGLSARWPVWADCWGGNLSVARAALIDMGGFGEPLSSGGTALDMELAFRLHQRGYTATYLPRAEAVHDDDKRRAKLLRDAQREGAGAVELVERHPGMLPQLLGWFGDCRPREIVLRRFLLALRLPPSVLARAGILLPGSGRKQVWFGFVSKLAFWHGVRSSVSRERWLQLTRGVPVLMYHAFSDGNQADRFVATKRSFGRQMQALSRLGFTVVSLHELARALRDGHRLPPRSAVITIDDGYVDNLEIAAPILRRQGFPATLFLVTGRLGARNDWTEDGPLAGRALASATQVRAARGHGLAFGAHTRTHASLAEATGDSIADEIEGSGEDLRRLLGDRIDMFAYPYGRYDGRAVVSASRAGYLAACTTDPRLCSPRDDPLQIPRLEVKGTDSLLRFVLKLWLGLSQ